MKDKIIADVKKMYAENRAGLFTVMFICFVLGAGVSSI